MTPPNTDPPDYRGTIAEMRAEWIRNLQHSLWIRNRGPLTLLARQDARMFIRRIRALDAVVQLARRGVCEVCLDCLEPSTVKGPRCERHWHTERYIDGAWDCDDAAQEPRQ